MIAAAQHREPAVAGLSRLAPSVLAVTSELPWPLDTGGHLRTFYLLRAVARRFRLRLVAPVAAGQEEHADELRRHGIQVCPAFVAPRKPWREALRALASAARREPYVLYRRHDRAAVRAELRRQCRAETPQALYLDHLDSLAFRPLLPPLPAVIDLHNVYSTLLRRTADEQRRWWTRLYLRHEARLLAVAERRAARSADALTAVSADDAEAFRALGPRRLHVVPNGVDCARYAALPEGRDAGPPTVLYVGAMSWGPNAAAARFLAAEVLPRVRAVLPDARLQVVGRDPPPKVKALTALPGVEVTGAVPDVLPYLRGAHLLAVPLEAGGGTRLKMLEAFAAGLPVVSTPVGCEGIEAAHGEHLLVADRSRFADAVLGLLGDAALRGRLATRARRLVRERYDWERVGEVACGAVAEVLGAGRTRGGDR